MSLSLQNSGQPKVTLYTASWCSQCRSVKRRLQELGMEYTEVDVDSKIGWDQAEKQGITSLPTVKAVNQYGSEVTYSGYVNLTTLKRFIESD